MAYFANNNPAHHRNEYNNRECNTDPIVRGNENMTQAERVRYNNTIKSNVMRQDPDSVKLAHEAALRKAFHEERPLQSGRTRHSCQDSNLFHNKDINIGTVQPGST
jgi:hypothetical protein